MMALNCPLFVSSAFGILLHLPTLNNPFIWDDRAAVAYNPDVLGKTTLDSLFKNDFWGQSMNLDDSHKSFRPLAVFSFRLNHSFHGLDPWGYHVVNIILHWFSVMIMTDLIRLFSNTELNKKKDKESHHNQRMSLAISLISGIIFSIHPVHTEVVASIVGRADLLCALFALSSIYIYIHADVHKDHYWKYNSKLMLSYLLAVFSTFSKEVGVTTFSLLISHELIEACLEVKCNFDNDHQTNIVHSTSQVIIYSIHSLCLGKRRRRFLKILISSLCILVVLLMHLSLHGETMLRQWSVLENDIAVIGDNNIRRLSYAWVHVRYWMKLVWPAYPGLCYDHGYPCIAHVTSITQAKALLSLLFYVSLLSFILKTISSSHTSLISNRIQLWSIAFIILPFLPASQLFFPVGTVLGERLLYLPSVGYSWLIGLSFYEWLLKPIMLDNDDIEVLVEQISTPSQNENGKITKSSPPNIKLKNSKKPTSVIGHGSDRIQNQKSCFKLVVCGGLLWCGYTLSLVFLTRARLKDWTSEKALFESALKVCPLSLKVQSNLALTLMNEADQMDKVEEQREQESKHALLERAAALLDRSIEIYPYFDAALYNRGLLYLKQGNNLEAGHYFARVLKIEPKNEKARCCLARAHLLLGMKLKEAMERGQTPFKQQEFQVLLSSASDLSLLAIDHGCPLPLCYWTAGAALVEAGQHSEAVSLLMTATALNRGDGSVNDKLDATGEQSVLNLLGISLRVMGNNDGAISAFDAGLKLAGASTHELLANSAALLADTGEWEMAGERYQVAIELSPNNAEIINNYGYLLEKQGDDRGAVRYYRDALRLLAPHGHPQIETNLRLAEQRISTKN